jgi:phosphohistidine phosphatase
MKVLLLLRHAKSSWKQSVRTDHDRPLNKRGKRTASLVGGLLQDEGLIPELILSSSAVRAYATAFLVAEACNYTGEIEQTRRLYQAEPQDFIEVLRQMDEKYARVLVVGHNPGLEMLIDTLTGEAIVMPTAALAHIELSIELWSDLNQNTECKLVNVWRPQKSK